jgi:hypothetical protein
VIFWWILIPWFHLEISHFVRRMQRGLALVWLSSPATHLLPASEEIVFSCHPSLAHKLKIDRGMVLQLALAHFTLRANRYAYYAITCID